MDEWISDMIERGLASITPDVNGLSAHQANAIFTWWATMKDSRPLLADKVWWTDYYTDRRN